VCCRTIFVYLSQIFYAVGKVSRFSWTKNKADSEEIPAEGSQPQPPSQAQDDDQTVSDGSTELKPKTVGKRKRLCDRSQYKFLPTDARFFYFFVLYDVNGESNVKQSLVLLPIHAIDTCSTQTADEKMAPRQ
jgi:hypothetical protein